MQKNGLAKDTIRNVNKALNALNKKCDLNNPEEVKGYIARIENKTGYKRQLTYAYDKYAQLYKIEWKKPIYWLPPKMPKIPLRNQIDTIISRASIKTATALAISRDTGLRPIELTNLTLKDIDLNKGIIYPKTAKHGIPRTLKLPPATLNMLNAYILKTNPSINDKIFGKWTTDNYGKSFRYYKNLTAKKLQDPTIKTIRLYDLRHFFATMLYKKTNNLVYVKQKMGHKKIDTTLIYVQLLETEDADNYACEIAENIEQSKRLIEKGFKYVTEQDGLKLFRKRK